MPSNMELISGHTLTATRMSAAATLAAALINAAGRPHSVKLMRDIEFSLWPSPNNSRYETWKKEFSGDEPHK
jgi:hypothetical protein